MKLNKRSLLEIMAIVEIGITHKEDISQSLRNLDFVEDENEELSLSCEYFQSEYPDFYNKKK